MGKCLAAAVMAGLVLGLGGFAQLDSTEGGERPKVISTMKRASHVATQTAEARHVAGRPLVVQTDNGAITAKSYDGQGVRIKAEVRAISAERLNATQIVVTRAEDESLNVRVLWPNNERYGTEGCAIEVLLPDATGIKLTTSNGRVETSGLSGEAVVRTSNARVSAERHGGALSVTTSNGAVAVRDVAGETTVRTSNGSVDIEGAGGAVSVTTSNAGVQVALRKESPGPVNITTSNAAITFKAGAAFSGRVDATTSNGRVTIKDSSGEQTFRGRGFVVSAGEGGGGEPSRLQTSNGSVRIEIEGRAEAKSGARR